MLFDPPLYLFLFALSSSFLLLPLCFFFSPCTFSLFASHTSVCDTQAQRKADSLHQALSALGDKVKQQTAPNKDIQKEIGDMTEVNGIFMPQRTPQQNNSVLWYQHVRRLCSQ